MSTIEEKRVYGERTAPDIAYVASGAGVLRVRIAGDTIGEFALCKRCIARDIAASGDRIAVATDENVFVATLEGDRPDEGLEDGASRERFEETGFGPAVAVGYDGGTLFAAGADGRVARRRGEDWNPLEADALAVRAIDGDFVGTDDGVYRVHDDGLDHAGLTDVLDVSAAGVPLAATADGLYKLGNGWMQVLEERVETVAADPLSEPGRLRRAHAVAGLDCYGYDGEGWTVVDRSSVPIVGIAYGEGIYAVTERGTALVATESETDGSLEWRSRTLGVGDVTGIAVLRRAGEA